MTSHLQPRPKCEHWLDFCHNYSVDYDVPDSLQRAPKTGVYSANISDVLIARVSGLHPACETGGSRRDRGIIDRLVY